MTALAGFLNVVLRGLGMTGLALALGGVTYALLVLRPFASPSRLRREALGRCLRLVAVGALVLAATQALLLGLQPWALADETGALRVREFFATTFAQAGLVRVALGVALAVTAVVVRRTLQSRAAWLAAGTLTVLIGANSAWLSHATGRLEHRGILMALEVFHQMAAAIWVGGLIHLVAFSLLRREPAERAQASTILVRFSALALGCVGGLVAAGISLSFFYVDGIEGFLGTGYGVMILTKMVVLAGALMLAGINLVAVRRVARSHAGPRADGRGCLPENPGPLAEGQGAPDRLWWFVEAEVGLGVTLLLAAAALTSLPVAADVREDRATLAEVGGRFIPKLPSFSTPPVGELLATAAPITDTMAERKRQEYEWSEYNHHVAGLFVVVMGLLALLELWGQRRWARHWPLLFLGLAAFLFVRNDPRAWPLGPAGLWESMLLPDVLQHRLAVALIVAFAVFEWAVRTGGLRARRWAYVFPLLCVGGGALLLTHSHALFNLKAEFLLEVTHAPLGVLGVFIGASRWLELRLPDPANRLPGRVWAFGLVLVGALLLFYREG
ncbi:MAG: CopD family protein [Candidatus Rokubacteria bacterium]|nr:CopD family protein [Candidatus Rokubacteria bacterium]